MPATAQATADGLGLPTPAAVALSAGAAEDWELVTPAAPAFADATPSAAAVAATGSTLPAAANTSDPAASQDAAGSPTSAPAALQAAAEQRPAAKRKAAVQDETTTMLTPMQPQQLQQQPAASTVPLHQLQLSPQAPLLSATRHPCPSCKRTRAFFCYDCLTPLMGGIPSFHQLPVHVHIVMHGETNAQATGTHAAMLAPSSVTLFRHNDGTSHHRRQSASKLQLPDWNPKTTAVLYPEGPDTPVVGLWGVLEQADQQQQLQCNCQQHGEQQCRQQLQQELQCELCKEQQCRQQDLAQTQFLQHEEQQCTAQQQAAEATGHSCHGMVVAAGNGRSSAAGATTASGADSNSSSRSTIDATTTSSSSSSAQYSCSGFPYKTVVVLEGNWAKARTLLKHPKIAPLPRLQLPLNVRSLFWRRGTGSFRAAVDCGVCTIEAVYLLCRQLQPEPQGQWDDLLWFFSYQRQLVQKKGSYQTRCEMQQNFEAACGQAVHVCSDGLTGNVAMA